jgi:hypothetical protein
VRRLYPTAAENYGSVTGIVTKAGSPVFGAAVYFQDAASNVVFGTVTRADGVYEAEALIPGEYEIWIAPLDDSAASPFLCKGSSIAAAFSSADTSFLPTPYTPITVNAGMVTTADFTVTDGNPAFRISLLRKATTNPGLYSASASSITMSVGQSNYYIGVLSTNLPTNSATLTVTGDGVTIGTVRYASQLFTNVNLPNGYNAISVPISISSNATPGLRNIVVQQGANIALANGFLEILPSSLDYNFDGLDDDFQRTYFSPFTSPQAAPNFDADGDGMDNNSEFVAGTNPTDALSLLRMLSPSNGPSGPTIAWESVSGRRYQVFVRSNATEGSWLGIGSPVTADGPATQYVDDTATNGLRLYRVGIVP